MHDSDVVRIKYLSLNKGDHPVLGVAVFAERFPDAKMRRVKGGFSFDYEHHAGGDEFDVHRQDAEAAPQLFQIIVDKGFQEPPKRWSPPPPPPSPIVSPSLQEEAKALMKVKEERGFVLDLIPGITPKVAEQLRADDIDSEAKLLALGVDGLKKYKGIGQNKATVIMEYLAKKK